MSRHRNRLLTKSRYIAGLQCPRYLWMQVHEPARLPPPDAQTQFIFDQGHEVGELAKRLFPQGIDLPTDDFAKNLHQTRSLLSTRKPLFEAAFRSGNKYARLDILQPAGGGAWNIIEVKSATGVKDIHYPDVAFQRHCCTKSGLVIDRCYVAHINNQFIKHGDIQADEFFHMVDVTEQVAEMDLEIEEQAAEMLSVLASPACPMAVVGPHCFEPYECPLREECWSFLPENSVFTLHRIGKYAFQLLQEGIVSLDDLPDGSPLTREQAIQLDAVKSRTAHVEQIALQAFLRRLEYPVHYLDFETFGTAIPLYDGIRPYQQVPFMFTLQIVRQAGKTPESHAFLSAGQGDPRPALISALCAAIGDHGSIVAYNASFEVGVLRSLGEAFQELRQFTDGLYPRMVDLLVPFRGFNYYHHSQLGSASLKKVLPALTGESYEEMAISDGNAAGLAYLSTLMDLPEEELQRMRAQLVEYCSLDTIGMVHIVERLTELSQAE